MAGAPVQAPMHSTSSSENVPDGETSLLPIPSRFLHVLVKLVAAAQHAGNIGADLNVIAPGRLAAQHRVIRERFGDLKSVQVQALRNFLENLIAQETELILGIEHHGNQRGALDGIASDQVVKLGFQLLAAVAWSGCQSLD